MRYRYNSDARGVIGICQSLRGSSRLYSVLAVCVIVVTVALFGIVKMSHVSALGLNCLSATAGSWESPGTWSSCNGGVPGAGDNVVIAHQVVLSSDINITTGNITVNTGGNLDTSASNFGLTATRLSVNAGGTFVANGSVITLSGTGTVFTRAGTFYQGTSTVRYTGNSTTNITSTTYYNLQVDHPSGTFTAAGNITVENVFLVNAGTFRGASRTITLTGAAATPLVLNGEFIPDTSTIVYAGDNPSGNISITQAGYHNLQINNAQETFVSTGDMAIAGRLTITSGTFDAKADTLTLSGTGTAFSKASSGIFAQSTSTVRYTGGTQNTTVAAVTYYNLELNHVGTTFTLANNITVANMLTIDAGSLNASSRTITFTGSAPEPFVNNDTFIQGTSTVSYEGSRSDEEITIAAVPYYNIAFNSPTGSFISHGDFAVSGNWTNLAGLFNANNNTVTFDGIKTSVGAGRQYDLYKNITSNGSGFDNVVFNNSAGGWQPLDDMVVNGNLVVAAGELIGNTNVTVRGGSVTGNGVINFVYGTFLLDGVGEFGGSTNWSFHNLNFGDGVATSATSKVASNSIIVTGTLRIAQNHSLDAGNDTWTLTGGGTPFIVDGHFDKKESTFRFAPYQTATITAADYYNLEIARSVVDTSEVWIPAYWNLKKFTNDGVIDGTYYVSVQPRGIAIDAEGNIWVASRYHNIIAKISRSGVVMHETVIGNTRYGLFGVVIDSMGNIWTLDFEEHTVKKINGATGGVMGTFSVSSGSWGGIAVDKSDNIWVANSRDNNVVKLGNDGATLGVYAVGDEPHSVGIDEDGNVWVANYDSHDVTKLNSVTGQVIGVYPTGLRPHAVFGDASGNMWVVNTGSNDVTKLEASTGNVIGTYPVGRESIGGSVDSDGNIWVESADDDAVVKLNGSTGELIGVYSLEIPAADWSYTFGDFTGFTLQHFICGGSCGTGKDVVISSGTLNVANNFTIGDGANPLTVVTDKDSTVIDVFGNFVILEHAKLIELSKSQSPDEDQDLSSPEEGVTPWSENNSLGTIVPYGASPQHTTQGIVVEDNYAPKNTTPNTSENLDKDTSQIDTAVSLEANSWKVAMVVIVLSAIAIITGFLLTVAVKNRAKT